MSLGPILIFDKSALQSLSIDEGCWLDNFFRCNITPLFFVETLADLEKEVTRGRSPEEIVGNIASKTPTVGSLPNVHHLTLCIRNLLGEEVEMRRVPIITGGIPSLAGGKKGVVFEPSREFAALERWQCGKFLEPQRLFAGAWRRSLAGLDLETSYRDFQKYFDGRAKPRDLPGVRNLVEDLIHEYDRQHDVLELTLDLLSIPRQFWPKILSKYESCECPRIQDFAPYAAHVLRVDLFFYLGIAADLISRERRSNKIDFGYLYYLPFCTVFVSNDNLHTRTVPLFLQDNQTFVNGTRLKADLRKLDDHYSQLPEDVKNRGIMSFAAFPPDRGNFLVSQLWDRFLPNWRSSAVKKSDMTEEAEADMIKEIRQFVQKAKPTEPSTSTRSGNADRVVFKRRVPARKGKWTIVPPEARDRGTRESN